MPPARIIYERFDCNRRDDAATGLAADVQRPGEQARGRQCLATLYRLETENLESQGTPSPGGNLLQDANPYIEFSIAPEKPCGPLEYAVEKPVRDSCKER